MSNKGVRPEIWGSTGGSGGIYPPESAQVCPGFLIVPGKGRIWDTPQTKIQDFDLKRLPELVCPRCSHLVKQMV
jgi:hypothetical protein